MTKGRHALVWCISDYAGKGRQFLLGARLRLATKVSASPFRFPPYNMHFQLGQNSGDA
jgi:hypothetical protein